MTDPAALSHKVIEEARALGFHRVGIAQARSARSYAAYEAWLAAGMHGDMFYLETPEHRVARADPRTLLAEARAVVAVALAHDPSIVPVDRLGRGPAGQVARYASGRDYHAVMKPRLRELARRISRHAGRPVAARPCVDTAPVLERELAGRAGLGFIGKNTMLIAPGLGSYILLGELLLDLELEASAEEPASRCGQCRACLDACPTGAFAGPFRLDARRCISYLTIENRGPIPAELRTAIGTRVFGCDVCQEVCPWNAAAPGRSDPEPDLRGTSSELDLIRTLGLGAAQLRKLMRGSALRRAGRTGLLRNVCVALGNAGDPAAVPALTRALADRSALVRGHAAWALGRLGAVGALAAALESESDVDVRAEIEAALAPD